MEKFTPRTRGGHEIFTFKVVSKDATIYGNGMRYEGTLKDNDFIFWAEDGEVGNRGFIEFDIDPHEVPKFIEWAKNKTVPVAKDNINPDHYKQGEVECIIALEAATVNKTGIEAVCTANIIKYLWRYEAKNGVEDVEKAAWYLERLINYLKKNNATR